MSIVEREKKRFKIAPESPQTCRARDKLRKQWEEEKKQITPAAIADTVEKIRQWIADNANHRTYVKGKSISLFDQNKNAARISKKIEQFTEKLKEAMQPLGRHFLD